MKKVILVFIVMLLSSYLSVESVLSNADSYDDLTDINSTYNKALGLLHAGEFNNAILAFNRLIDSDQIYIVANSYINIGVAYGSLGEINNAISSFEKAIEVDQNNADAYLRLALMYDEDLNKRKSILNRALELEPNNAAINAYLGMAYVALRQSERGEPYLRKSINVKPSNLKQYNLEKQAYAFLGNCLNGKEALPYLERALVMDPDYIDAHIFIGAAFAENKQYKISLEHFEKAKELSQKQENANGLYLAERGIKLLMERN